MLLYALGGGISVFVIVLMVLLVNVYISKCLRAHKHCNYSPHEAHDYRNIEHYKVERGVGVH
jgi:hypothetical protein